LQKLSVIIVNYNVKHFLEQCLYSVKKASQKLAVETIVIDNNSLDGSCEMLKLKFPDIVLIENKQNLGFSKANNQGIELSTGEYTLLLNPDTLVQEDTFDKVIEFMDKHPKAGGLGVKMIDGKGNFLPESKRGLPTPSVAFYKIFGLSALFPNSKNFGQYHLGYLDKNQLHEIDVLSGAFMLLRKKTLDEIGLLDEAFFMYGEDIDLSYRIIKAGYKNYYYPHTSIIHYKGESTKKSSINYVFVFYRAMVIFAQKHFSKQNASLFSILINAAIYFRASLAIISRFAKKAFLPATDFLLIILSLYLIKNTYSSISQVYYPVQLIAIALPTYAFIWVCSILFSGGYDKPIKIQKLFLGFSWGTIIILILYSLLSEEYRFSRAIILLGFLASALTSLAWRALLHFTIGKDFSIGGKSKKRFAIVGELSEIERVSNLLKLTTIKPEFIAAISADNSLPNPLSKSYLANLSQLKEVVDIFKINEIIFCSQNLSSNLIIQQMSILENPDLDFKIAPQESPFVIGSNSINTSGELYSVLTVNAITKQHNKRNKRFIDIFFSFLFLVFLPIVLVFVKNKKGFINNCFSVLFGNISWVGYSKIHVNLIELPKIKNAVVSPLDIHSNEMQHAQNAFEINKLYAKNYNTLQDISLILKLIKHLGNKPK
jgi:GT2 family glycosyltransferase